MKSVAEHPLFPATDDKEAPADIVKISVTRWENGHQIWAARMFDAHELTELQQVQDIFGGGRYELIGRDAKRIARRVSYTLSGAPKPLDGSTPTAPVVPAPTAAVAQAAMPGAGGGDAMTMLFGFMQNQMNQQQQFFERQQQMARESNAMQLQMTQQFAQAMVESARAGAASAPAAVPIGQQLRDATGAIFEVMQAGQALAAGGREAAAEGGAAFDPAAAAEHTLNMLERAKRLADAPPSATDPKKATGT